MRTGPVLEVCLSEDASNWKDFSFVTVSRLLCPEAVRLSSFLLLSECRLRTEDPRSGSSVRDPRSASEPVRRVSRELWRAGYESALDRCCVVDIGESNLFHLSLENEPSCRPVCPYEADIFTKLGSKVFCMQRTNVFMQLQAQAIKRMGCISRMNLISPHLWAGKTILSFAAMRSGYCSGRHVLLPSLARQNLQHSKYCKPSLSWSL